MSIFSEARKFFEKGDYTKALELYEEAGKSFGKEVVSYHVQRCKELLGDSYGLDKITQILLSNSDSDKKTSDELLAFYKELTKQKSEDAQVKTVKPIPAAWPSDLSLAPLPESTNDFEWYGAKKNHNRYKDEDYGLSIIIPTFNRAKLLDVTLACLVNQKTNFNFEAALKTIRSLSTVLKHISIKGGL